MLPGDVWDYIVVGGGIAGSVLSNRLHALKPQAKILLIEAGPNVNDRTDILYVNSTNNVGGDFDWNYMSVPQKNLAGRSIQSAAGKALGGGSVINTCGWIRGNKIDYDEWASVVGDNDWNYNSWLPYFKACETFWSKTVNTPQHGLNGPLQVEVPSTTGRQYPLRDIVLNSYDAVGIKALPGLDANAGNNLGVGENAEDRRQGKRQVSAKYFPLDGVTVMTNTLVEKILIKQGCAKDSTTQAERRDDGPDADANAKKPGGQKPTAYGVQLVDGTKIMGKEIIASAGTYRTPQLLMLSGVGPAATLKQYKIDQKLDAPQVGKNFFDHIFYLTQWQLSKDYMNSTVDSGNPLFFQPQYGLGQPNNFVASFTVDDQKGLAAAIAKDEGKQPSPSHPALKNARTFLEAFVLYINLNPALPSDHTYLTVANVGLYPTSRGSVTISSANPRDPPVIDANFYATETDRFVWRFGLRKMIDMMVGNSKSPMASKKVVTGEVPPAPGLKQLAPGISDKDIDARVGATAIGTYHPMGTCAMGKVVDTDLRLIGVDGLRVVDASVFPTQITAHIQTAVYALGLKAADIIAGKH